MNIRNTITAVQETAVGKALFTFEALSDPCNAPILDFLLEHRQATILDLTIATATDAETLEMQMDALCQTKVVQLRSDLYRNWYQIDYQLLQKVSAIATQLVRRK
ncbi:MAG: hypothetical protein ACK4TA_10270 [Saprospiraceae bacterium]